MRTLPIPIDSDSIVKEPHDVPFNHRFSCIATIKNEWSSQSMEVLKYRFFLPSVGLVKFLFCFFCLLLFFFSEVYDTDWWNEDEHIKYRTEPTFRYLIVGIRYFSVFEIPTSVSVSVFKISDIGSVFSVYDPWLGRSTILLRTGGKRVNEGARRPETHNRRWRKAEVKIHCH